MSSNLEVSRDHAVGVAAGFLDSARYDRDMRAAIIILLLMLAVAIL